ncbi:MAG: helix-turn-helix transcriptional regulator [Victivallales bacterium]|nr:helix-turn-helix transcriptional regulator [Victivallales bacterium]
MHEFFICLNNQGIQHIEGQRCAFQRGRAFMLYSGCKHHIEFMPGVESEFIFVCFDKNHLAKSGYLRLQEQLKNRQIKKCYFSGNTPDYLNFNVETIRLLYKEFSSPGLLQNELIDSLLVQLLVAFLRSTNLEASTINPKIDKKRLKITRLCQRAAMDSSLEITLAQAARKTGTCRSVFAALTKEITGLSWREYILDCRLKKSIDLLATTDMQILQVAFTCHFNNIAYFHRTFLKKYGNTPGKMRRILQQNSFPHILKEFK